MTSREIEILAAAGTPPNMDPETWSRFFVAMTGQDAGKGKGKDTGKGACKGTGVDAEGGGGGKGKGEDVGGGGGKGKGENAGNTDAEYSLRHESCARVYLMEAGTTRLITAHDIAAHDADTDDVGADNANN
jgi:hypothetical protein